MAEFKIEGDVLGQMIGAAVLGQIGQEQRDLLVQAAITHLLNPERGQGMFGSGVSPLQKAFNQAVEMFARKHVSQELEANGELAEKVKAIIADGIEAAVVAGREKLVEKISKAVADSFGPQY